MSDAPAWIHHALTPLPEDSADLRWAVETAASLWSRGDRHECVRWLQHAAQRAHAEGRQQRTADLTRAASELDLISRQHAEPEPSASMKRTTPYRIAPDDITRLVAPDSQLLDQCESSTQKPQHFDTDPDYRGPPASLPASAAIENARQDRPRPPPSVADAEATMAAVQAPRKPVNRTMLMPSFTDAQEEPTDPTAAPAESPPIAAPAPASVERAEQTRAYGSPEPGPLEPMRAVRVAVEPGSGSRLALLLLSEGEPAPEGTQEALLLPIGPARGSS
jgi:hypothetical protein